MICLSFDTDRMTEDRMRSFLVDTPVPGRATFFCTDVYASLAATDHELAPHPYLGAGNDWDEELERKRRDFPDAVGWRSHSCVFSHVLAERLASDGYRYVSIHDDLGSSEIRPVRHAWGLWHMPIYYMDNLDFSARRFWDDGVDEPFRSELIDTAVHGDALFVFDFHPIHLSLNSPNAEEYFARRARFETDTPVDELRFEGRGARTFYLELVEAMNALDVESVAMSEALEAFMSKGVSTSAR